MWWKYLWLKQVVTLHWPLSKGWSCLVLEPLVFGQRSPWCSDWLFYAAVYYSSFLQFLLFLSGPSSANQPICFGRSEKLNMLWKAVSPQSPVSILLRKKFLKKRTFYSLRQTASFNPAIFVLSTNGNVNTSPSPSHNQTRSATIKCLNCMKTVWSNCKRLLCEKCLSLTHAHCIDILPMELKHAVLLNRYVTIVP